MDFTGSLSIPWRQLRGRSNNRWWKYVQIDINKWKNYKMGREVKKQS
jgi:hypothetical protein